MCSTLRRRRRITGPGVLRCRDQSETGVSFFRHLSKNGQYYVSSNRFQMLSKVGQEYIVDGYSRVQDDRLSFERSRGINQTKASGSFLTSSFFGSPKCMKEKARDAMTLVRTKGLPLFFITVTCSKSWKDFDDVLLPGQDPLDSPSWVSRIFHRKLKTFLKHLLYTHRKSN